MENANDIIAIQIYMELIAEEDFRIHIVQSGAVE